MPIGYWFFFYSFERPTIVAYFGKLTTTSSVQSSTTQHKLYFSFVQHSAHPFSFQKKTPCVNRESSFILSFVEHPIARDSHKCYVIRDYLICGAGGGLLRYAIATRHILLTLFLFKKKTLRVIGESHFNIPLWSWRGSNPRPNNEIISFLHV
jgi:hypothetical protein